MKHKKLLERFPSDIRKIAEVVGIEAAIKIAMEFKGTHLYIGSINRFLRELRNQRIRQDFDMGISARRLSIKYNITERWVWKILGRTEECPTEMLRLLEGSDTPEPRD